jgi:peptidyl-prolyl cis-trans isomerase C
MPIADRNWLSRWVLREPMLLFFAVGAGLFALAPRAERGDQVHLSRSSLRALEQVEARRRNLTELPADIAAAVRAQAVDDELLYREGLRLGLDKSDNIVRQRVIEKMLFLAEDLAGSARPIGDEELERYLAAHPEAFRRPSGVSFVHVFASGDIGQLIRLKPSLAAGTEGEAAQPPDAGDAFPLGRRVIDATLESVRVNYGPAFAAALETIPPGVWSAPVRSPYGHHLVKVLARSAGGAPALGEVRAQVRLAYLQERQERATAEFRRLVRARYRVTIDDGEGAAPAGGAFAGTAAAAAAREAD